ncbi:Hypothetical protein, putative [Bodo saltans]|uniref:Uncharacterized protein n=1 Tax=Bodo saltans TaxID=75058 RepID=A0A0S4KLY2_BODSA|nr:Hypothetical protein, putative [Bodo saltans]|eukprot:CUI15389.1 Hypothetical protein, putative [Bodo saltans]
MGCAVSAQKGTTEGGRKKKKGTKKRTKKQQQMDEGANQDDCPGDGVLHASQQHQQQHQNGAGDSRGSDTAAGRRRSIQEFPVNSATAGVSSHHDDNDSPKTGEEETDHHQHHHHRPREQEPERSVPVVMNPLVASPNRIPSGSDGMSSIPLSRVVGQQQHHNNNGNSVRVSSVGIPQPPNHSLSLRDPGGESTGKGSQVSASLDARSHSLVPIGARDSATSSNRKQAEERRQLVGQIRGADVASDCSNDGSTAAGADADHHRKEQQEDHNEVDSDSRSDVEDPRRPSEFPDQTDDPEVAAMRLSCPEFHVDAAPLFVLVQLFRQGKLPINQNGDHTIGGAFRTKMRFRDVAGWMAEVGTIPAGVVSLSHQDRSKGQSNDQKLTARLLEQNHRLLLQLRSRTTPGGAGNNGNNNSGYPTNAPLNFVASLSGPQGGSPALGSVSGGGAGSPVFQTAQQTVSGGNASSGLASSTPHVVPPNMFTKTSGVDQNNLLGAGNGGGSSFEDDAARRYSRGSNRNKIPDRNTGGEDDFDATNFYEELEDEERRLSTIKESSSDEDF